MTDRQTLAEHATGLGVAGLATMGLNAAALIPLAVLAAWGIDRYKSCAQRKQRETVNRVVKQIEKANPDHRAVGPALALLKESQHKVAISPAILADAETRGDFPAALYDMIFAGVEVPKHDGVEALLRMVLTAAWQDLRLDEARQFLRDARAIVRGEKLCPVLEGNAKLVVGEAETETELLDHNPDHAFTLLSAAADSFASIDPLEPARRRANYNYLLYQHGLRYRGPAVASAAQMMRDTLSAPRRKPTRNSGRGSRTTSATPSPLMARGRTIPRLCTTPSPHSAPPSPSARGRPPASPTPDAAEHRHRAARLQPNPPAPDPKGDLAAALLPSTWR